MRRAHRVELVAGSIAIGAFLGFVVYVELQKGEHQGFLGQLYRQSKEKMSEVSEEAALKRAKLTNNPGVNQEWVTKQWESIGY